jgi:hypothetical protein
LRSSVTVPVAGEYSVGLTAATTVPCAATSFRNPPRVTVAIRTRSRDTVASLVAHDRSSATRPSTTSSSSAPPPAIQTRRSRHQPWGASSTRSCASVLRMEEVAVRACGSGILVIDASGMKVSNVACESLFAGCMPVGARIHNYLMCMVFWRDHAALTHAPMRPLADTGQVTGHISPSARS